MQAGTRVAKFSRQHYIAVADALRKAHDDTPADVKADSCPVCYAANYITDAFAQDNPRFNREHFLAVVKGERELTSRPPRNGPCRVTQPSNKLRVECMECSKRFSTTSMLPECPKCGSTDVDLTPDGQYLAVTHTPVKDGTR
jgi:ribosomal protein S27E